MEIASINQSHVLILKSSSPPPPPPPRHTCRNQNYSLSKQKLFTVVCASCGAEEDFLINRHNYPNTYYYNVSIRKYAKTHTPQNSLLIFFNMMEQGLPPDKFTLNSLVSACSNLQDAFVGRQIHGIVYKCGLQIDIFIHNCLIHMYANCRDFRHALQVFDEIPQRDVVSWTSIIDACVNNGLAPEALRLFRNMRRVSMEPNEATLVSVLKACAELGALSTGEEVHDISKRMGFDSRSKIVTGLIDMYAKCGQVETARQIFDEKPRGDVFSWTAMISGLANYGLYEDAMDMFNKMQQLGIKPDGRTLTAVLGACRNADLVDEGMRLFMCIERNFGIRHKVQHYGCIVHLLVRAGRLEEAVELIKGMPMEPDAIIWRTLIWGCKMHGDSLRGESLFMQKLLVHGADDSGSLVLLCNLYASVGKWHERAQVRKAMQYHKIDKPPGRSVIEVNGLMYEFVAGDSSHPQSVRIYEKLDEISEKLKQVGYRPNVSEVMLDMEDEEKITSLHHHSEKLAVAFGLISVGLKEKILVVKNLRSCRDCHNSMKLVSKIYGRELVIRDRVRFHHFKDGLCSCNDNW